MKKSIKNISISLLSILMIVAIIVTINLAKGTNKMTEGSNTPPEMPQGEIPNSQNGQNMPSGSTETPPEKPSGDNNQNNQNNQNDGTTQDNSNNMTPPSIPQGNGSNQNGMQPINNMESMNGEDNQISSYYYVAFGIEGCILALSLMYLIMSNLNNKSFKETFSTGDKTVIYLLAVTVITIILVFVASSVTKNLNSDETSNGNPSNMPMGQNSNSNITYSSAKEVTEDEDITSGNFESSEKDQNALGVNGEVNANISGVTVNKTGDSDGGDNTSFYGTNSAIIARGKANLTLKNIEVTTNATGANGVFCYGGSATTNNQSGDGTKIVISDSKITTTKDNSGGIMTTGGGEMEASNLEINTAGVSSAAIRTDRGGGNVTVNGGTYTTTGQGSPAIYSTANIKVSDASLISKASEGVVIEGKNSVSLTNCKLVDSNTKLNGQSTTYKNIFLYQSMSGDAAEGTSSFVAKDSEITTNNGDLLYVTNTTATITLENNKLVNNDENGNFLRVQKDSWGNSGSNGGEVTLNLKNQEAKGSIVIDSISTLVMNVTDNSYYEGTINNENQAKSISLKLDSSSKIKLTKDTYVSSFEDEDSSYSNIDFNGYKLYVNGKAIN